MACPHEVVHSPGIMPRKAAWFDFRSSLILRSPLIGGQENLPCETANVVAHRLVVNKKKKMIAHLDR